jgi:peptidoglycan/LPS O-acetylase OafA/YrhL
MTGALTPCAALCVYGAGVNEADGARSAMHFRIFDAWRLTAALLIMTYHFLYAGPMAHETPGIAFLYRLLPLLDMFFMMSGFFIAARYARRLTSPAAYADFMRRRVARVYPLHLLTLGFFAVLGLVFASGLVATAEPERWNLAALPANILAIHALGTTDALTFNYVSWSVGAEIFCYALFPLVVFAFRRAGLSGLVLLLAVWVTGLEAASAAGLLGNGHWLKADIFGAYRAFADFVLGAIVAVLVERRLAAAGGRPLSHLPGFLALGLAVATMLLQASPYLTIALFAAAMLFTASAETARPDSTRILAPLASISRVAFSIYLLHPVMETLFLSLLWKRVLAPVEPSLALFYAYLAVPMAATVAVAVLSERFVEPRLARLVAGPGKPRRAAAYAPA